MGREMYRERFTTLRMLGQTGVKPSKFYDVAYLIRMKNEAESLQATINSIAAQEFAGSAIVVFLDSGSTDDTLRIAAATPLPHVIYAIDAKEFRFGETCNLIAELAPARYLMFLSGHVVLNQNRMIAASIDHLDAHDDVAALAFRQVPNPMTGFNLYEEAYLRRTFPQLLIAYADIGKAGAFSNAASLIRADVWKTVPFEDVLASEDHLWSKAVRSRGLRIVYSAGFNVAHSHDETPEAVFKRVRINKLAQFGESAQPLRFVRTLLGIFGALTVASRGRRPMIALTYALAHATAYLTGTNPFGRQS
jgi:rhamnosyltransferase